jgi:Fe-S cluster assembly iron-binding protein IscA
VKVVFEKELGKFLKNAEIDYRQSFFGGTGFCVNTGREC